MTNSESQIQIRPDPQAKRARVSSKFPPEVPVNHGNEMEVDSSLLNNITNDTPHELDIVPATNALHTDMETNTQPQVPAELLNQSEILPLNDSEMHEAGENHAEGDVDIKCSGSFIPPPAVDDAKLAYKDVQEILYPRKKTGAGRKGPGLDLLLRKWLDKVKLFLWAYINATGCGAWVSASLQTAKNVGEGPWCACML